MGNSSSPRNASISNPKLAPGMLRRHRVPLLAGVCVFLVGLAWLTQTPARLCCFMAELSLNQHQPHQAMSWVQRAIQLSSENGNPQLLAARAQLQLNKGRTARYWLERAAQSSVPVEIISNYQTIVAAQAGESAAINALMNNESTVPLPAEAFEAIVRGLQLQGNLDRAGLILDELSRTSTSAGMIYYQRGRNAEIQENFSDALAHYQKSLQAEPRSARAAFRAGKCLIQQRGFDQAAEIFRKLNSPPYAAIGLIEDASCLWELGQYDQAAESIQTALTVPPEQLQSLYLELDEYVDLDRAAMTAARIEDARGNSDRAVELLERVLAFNHRSFEGRTLLIKHLRLLDRNQEADQLADLQQRMILNRQRCREIRTLLDSSPNNVELRCELAELYYETESEAEAQLLLTETLEMAPDCERAKALQAKISAIRHQALTTQSPTVQSPAAQPPATVNAP